MDLSESFALKILNKGSTTQSNTINVTASLDQSGDDTAQQWSLTEFKDLYRNNEIVKELVIAAIENRQIVPSTVMAS